MSGVVVYQSSEERTSSTSNNFGSVTRNSLSWTYKVFTEESFDASSETNSNYLFMAWEFDWNAAKKLNVIGYKGHIAASYKTDKKTFVSTQFNVELKRSDQILEKRIAKLENIPVDNCQPRGSRCFKYDIVLTPVYGVIDKFKHADKFESMTLTDAVLLVEKQKIHVNKAFLSYQSEYFNSLFNSDFKEKNITEIPIEDVKYEDFALLLSVIHSNPIPPTDATAPKLLELANRFLMPAVTCHVESYLLNSALDLTEKLCLADKYNLKRLIDNCASQLKTQRNLRDITRSEHFELFSQDTQYKILQRFLSIS